MYQKYLSTSYCRGGVGSNTHFKQTTLLQQKGRADNTPLLTSERVTRLPALTRPLLDIYYTTKLLILHEITETFQLLDFTSRNHPKH